MALLKTGLERIHQPLAQIGARHQPIDQHVDALEIGALVIVGRSKIDLPTLGPEAGETPPVHTLDQPPALARAPRRAAQAVQRVFPRSPHVRVPMSSASVS